jgi:hypothetical protein
MEHYPETGTRVAHKTHGEGAVQEVLEHFHPHHKELMCCFVKFDGNPTVLEVDVEALTEVKS